MEVNDDDDDDEEEEEEEERGWKSNGIASEHDLGRKAPAHRRLLQQPPADLPAPPHHVAHFITADPTKWGQESKERLCEGVGVVGANREHVGISGSEAGG